MKLLFPLKNDRGVTIIAAIVAMMVLTSLAVTLAVLYRREAELSAGFETSLRSWAEMGAGLERAVSDLADDDDWSDTPSTLFSDVPLGAGSYSSSTSSAKKDSISLKCVGKMGKAKVSQDCGVTGVSAAFVCAPKTDYDPAISCHPTSTITVNSQTDLDDYLADYGISRSPVGNYKRLKINFTVTGVNVELHVPCELAVVTGKSITATGSICLDSLGLNGQNLKFQGRANLSAANSLSLISQLASVDVRADSLSATDATIKGTEEEVLLWGPFAVTNDLTLEGKDLVELDANDDDMSTVSGTLTLKATGAMGAAVIDADSKIEAGAITITSNFKATIKRNAEISVTGNFHMDAPLCDIHPTANITAASLSGNCFP